jgi:hypothetical protein
MMEAIKVVTKARLSLRRRKITPIRLKSITKVTKSNHILRYRTIPEG